MLKPKYIIWERSLNNSCMLNNWPSLIAFSSKTNKWPFGYIFWTASVIVDSSCDWATYSNQSHALLTKQKQLKLYVKTFSKRILIFICFFKHSNCVSPLRHADFFSRISTVFSHRSNICCPRDCVSRHNGGTSGAPLKPLSVDSALSLHLFLQKATLIVPNKSHDIY